ncbi:condensation domain-containing protein, partial [Streptomyces varsoviensis]
MSRQSRVIEDILPLSPLQEGLLFHSVYDEAAPDVYTVQLVFHLDGELDHEAMRAAGGALLQRHSNLRVAFRQRKTGEWAQLVARTVPLPWADADLSAIADETERTAEADRLVAADRARRFDVTRPPLVRFLLVKLAERQHRLVLSMHHTLLDGWSLPVLLREFYALYISRGDASGLPEARPYRHYLDWLAAQDRPAAERAWRESLAGLTEPTRIAPMDAGRLPTAPRRHEFGLTEEATAALVERARAHGLTLNTVVQGAWALVLGRLTGSDDAVFGVTVSGRPADLPGVEDMVGLFINTLPLRARLRPAEPLARFLARVQEEQSRLLDHQHLGLADIQRQAGIGELFDTSLVFENFPLDQAREQTGAAPGGLRVSAAESTSANHYTLSLVAMPHSSLGFRFFYQPDLLSEADVETIGDRLLQVLDAFTADPDLPVGRTGVLRDDERHQLLDGWNDTAREVPAATLPELFEAQAARTPDAPALMEGDTSLTYAELNARANRLARALVGRGVGPEQFVAIVLPRSAENVVAMLAVLKAGGAYVPVDPEYPDERIAHMLADSRPVLTLTEEEIGSLVSDGVSDDDLGRVPAQSHAAYMIYTSGSTGVPKGVVVEHRSLGAYLLRAREAYGEAVAGVSLVHSPLAFDLTVTALYTPLVSGGCVR